MTISLKELQVCNPTLFHIIWNGILLMDDGTKNDAEKTDTLEDIQVNFTNSVNQVRVFDKRTQGLYTCFTMFVVHDAEKHEFVVSIYESVVEECLLFIDDCTFELSRAINAYDYRIV